MAGPTNLHSRIARLERSCGSGGSIFFRLADWAEGCPIAFKKGEDDDETIARMEANALDRLVAAGKIRDTDRERVTFIVHISVHPPKREDDPRRKDPA